MPRTKQKISPVLEEVLEQMGLRTINTGNSVQIVYEYQRLLFVQGLMGKSLVLNREMRSIDYDEVRRTYNVLRHSISKKGIPFEETTLNG